MSLPPIAVTLVEYDPEWPQIAEWHIKRLRLLGQNIIEVYHHIGSTSVLGLAAKPIIDLMPIVTDLMELDRQRHLVEALGYAWHGELGIADRRYVLIVMILASAKRSSIFSQQILSRLNVTSLSGTICVRIPKLPVLTKLKSIGRKDFIPKTHTPTAMKNMLGLRV